MRDRVLALDFGEVRIGIAISDPFGWTAQPLPFVVNNGEKWEALKKLITEYDVKEILIGLPKNQHGEDSEKAKIVRVFAQEVLQHLGIEPFFRDERYSTVAANRHLISMDMKRAKRKLYVDSQSAAFVLQGYLDAKK